MKKGNDLPMSTVWIIRHGQASFGNADYDQLSDIGIVQSRILGRYLKSIGLTFDTAYAGTMKRQIDTALHTLTELSDDGHPMDMISESAFNEYDFKPIINAQLPGLLEQDPSLEVLLPNIFNDNREFQKLFGRIIDRWVSGNHDTPGVETYKDYVRRVSDGLLKIATTGDEKRRVAVFTSGGVISVAMQISLGLSDHEAMRLGWWVKNTSVTVLNYRKNRFDIHSFNTLSHLELENRPELLTFR